MSDAYATSITDTEPEPECDTESVTVTDVYTRIRKSQHGDGGQQRQRRYLPTVDSNVVGSYGDLVRDSVQRSCWRNCQC